MPPIRERYRLSFVPAGRRTRAIVSVLAFCATLLVSPAVRAQGGHLIRAHDVPGSPQEIAVESPGRVWFTLPEENAIGLLARADDGSATVTTHPLPNPGSEPYDISVAGGAVWFTERAGNRIGRLDLTTLALREYDLPTAGSEPTSLDALVGTTTQVWYTATGAGRLGRLSIGAALEGTFEEFTLPAGSVEARPRDVAIQSATRVWVTVPNRSLLYLLQVTTGIFAPVQTGAGSAPWSIAYSDHPWFTDIGQNRIGSWNPNTLSIVYWRDLPHADSGPYGLDVRGGYVWFTEQSGQRVGRLSTTVYRDIMELAVPGVTPNPAGIATDATGAVWVAAPGAGQILHWPPPYFFWQYLPFVR